MKKLTVTGVSKTDIAKKLNLIRDMLKKGYSNGIDWEYKDVTPEFLLEPDRIGQMNFRIIKDSDKKEDSDK